MGCRKDGKRDYVGVQINPDGSSYEGEWLNDKPHGYGRFTLPNGDVFEGIHFEGNHVGPGIFYEKDKSTFIEKIEDSLINGFVKEVYKDGIIYQGFMDKGSKNGHGIY